MRYDFDRPIDRHGTNSGKWEFGSVQNSNAGLSTIPFWIADMDFGCPPAVLEALHRRVDREILGYSMQFTGEFFRSVCGWFQHRFGWYVNSKDIYYCGGVVPAINYLIRIMSHEGDRVIVQPPVYRPFYKKIECCHRIAASNRLICKNGHYEIDFEDFEEKARDPRTTLFILCSPHNPTGRVWTREELTRMGRICFANGVRIISDEIHHDIVSPDARHIPLESLFPERKNEIVTCTSVSKTFNLAGMAYSNIIIHDPHLKALWEKHVQGGAGVMMPNPLSITAIQTAYEAGEPWLDQANAYFHENLLFTERYLREHLPLAGMTVPEGTYFAWIDVAPYLRGAAAGEDVDSYLAKTADILIESRSGGEPIFGAGGETRIRMNTACPRALLEEGLRRMCAALGRVCEGDTLEDAEVRTPWKKTSLSRIADRPTAFIFLRYFGCPMTRLDMRDLKNGCGALAAAGAKAAVVLQSAPETVREGAEEGSFPFEIICDPERELYRRFGILPAFSKEKASAPRAIRKLVRAREAGFTQGRREGCELQLPAVFLTDGGLRVTKAVYGTDPADVPSAEQIAGWIREAE